jgi:acetyl-CoA carboxylase biotin carboxyl carrier protein
MDELKHEQGELPEDLAKAVATELSDAAPSDQLDALKELVEFLKSSAIAEFDLERPNLKLRLKFQGAEPAVLAPPAFDMAQLARAMNAAQHPTAGAVAQTHVAPAAAPEPVAAAPAAAANHIVKSPLVGTVYESPSPGAAPFVKIGDVVEVGQVLCIVEAMKLMNEIESDAAGEIVARIAVSGHPVEYGQPLFEIKVR